MHHSLQATSMHTRSSGVLMVTPTMNDDLFTTLNLSQIVNEPTNFTPNSQHSCIDLIVTDQPNIILNSGVRPSLDPK